MSTALPRQSFLIASRNSAEQPRRSGDAILKASSGMVLDGLGC